MSTSEFPWKTLLNNWPEAIARRGIIITTLNDQIPFNGFMTSENLVVFSRNTPDAVGARTVMLQYETIAVIKMTDVIKSPEYRLAGFQGELGRQ